MAENEILDIGNPRRYRRFRLALADSTLTAAQVADSLPEDALSVLRSSLRGKPVYLVLRACGQDRAVLQAAVDNLKNRAIATYVEQAFRITRSNDPPVVAAKIAELIVEGVVDQVRRRALDYAHYADSSRCVDLEREARARLENCRPEIIGLLAASLRNETIPRSRRIFRKRVSAGTVVSMSLRDLLGKGANGPAKT